MAIVRIESSDPNHHADDLLPSRHPAQSAVSPLDRPAERPHPRVEAGKVASALTDVISGESYGVSRRGFLQGMGAASTVAVAGGYMLKIAAPDRAGAVIGSDGYPVRPPGSLGGFAPNRTLVILELSGGNDSWSMVVPYTRNAY